MRIRRTHPDAVAPIYASAGAACFDLATHHPLTVPARGAATVHTGLAFEVPDGHVLLLFSRSGHGFHHGLRLGNCVGVIDADYRGEVLVRLQNDRHIAYSFEPGDRVAQGLVLPVQRVPFEIVTELSATERGAGGLGSTGA